MSQIANFADSYHNLISLLASIATISISILAYQLSRKTYNNSLPNILLQSTEVNFDKFCNATHFYCLVNLNNIGNGDIFWGYILLYDLDNGGIYQSLPIYNLKATYNAKVNISYIVDKKFKNYKIEIYLWNYSNGFYFSQYTNEDSDKLHKLVNDIKKPKIIFKMYRSYNLRKYYIYAKRKIYYIGNRKKIYSYDEQKTYFKELKDIEIKKYEKASEKYETMSSYENSINYDYQPYIKYNKTQKEDTE